MLQLQKDVMLNYGQTLFKKIHKFFSKKEIKRKPVIKG